MRKDPGIYALIIWLDSESTITLGKFCEHTFPRGWYVYVGRAVGAGSLAERIDQ